MRLRVAVFPSQIAPFGAFLDVAVFDEGGGHFRRAGAEIETQQRLGVDQFAPVHEFIGAELVGVQSIPGPVQHRRPLVLRTDAIQPVITRHEIAARIADDRDAQFADFGDDVFAKAFFVGQFRAGLIDTGIDRAAQVLEEGTEQAAIQAATDIGPG